MWTAFFAFTGVFLLIATAGIFLSRSSAHRRLSQIVASPRDMAVLEAMSSDSRAARIQRLLHPFQGVVPRSAKEVSNLRKLLARAGYREPNHVNTYYAAK